MAENYKTTALPQELHEAIEKLIQEHPELGYKSVLEFVKDSVRRRLEDFHKFPKEG